MIRGEGDRMQRSLLMVFRMAGSVAGRTQAWRTGRDWLGAG